MNRLSPLTLLIVTLWTRAQSWPPAARARLPELRALVTHHRLPCPAREHDAIEPDPRTLRRLLETACVWGELRALPDLTWALELLVCDLEHDARRGAL